MAARGGPGALGEWRAHWQVVVPCFFGIMLVAGHAHALGVMIRPLEQHYGWARAQISAGLMIVSIIAVLVSPIAGAAVDRIGARRIALVGVPLYCAAHGALGLAGDSVVGWWGLWILVGLTNMLVMPVVWLSVLNGYFERSRGLAMAIALSGTGMSAAVFPIVTNTLVDALGWRQAYFALGGISVAACLPLTWLLFRPNPGRARAMADASTQRAAATSRSQIASPRYLKLAAASVVFAVASCALTTNMVPVLIGEGLTPQGAAATAGLLGIGSITGRLIGGMLLDRFNGNLVAAGSVLVPIVPTAILLGTDHSQLWTSVACLLMGLSIGTELDCCAYLAARHFGTRNFGALFGTINGLLLFGAGTAPFAANAVYDATRSYDLVLMTLVPLFIAAAVLFATLGRYPDLADAEDETRPAPIPAEPATA